MAEIRQLPRAHRRGVGSFADWVAEREVEQEALDRLLTADMLAEHRERARGTANGAAPAGKESVRRGGKQARNAAAPTGKESVRHASKQAHHGAAHAKARTVRPVAPSAPQPESRATKPADARRLSPAAQHRMQRLRPVPTGAELRRAKRVNLAERLIVLVSVALVMAGALVSVVVRAEIAKMQLNADTVQPTLAKLGKENALLATSYQQLSAPARIAAIAQSQLHMVFAPGAGITASTQPGSTYSAQGQVYSYYYSPSGVTTSPPTTVTTLPPKSTSTTVAGAAAQASTTASTAPGAAASTQAGAAASAPSTTSPPTTTQSTLPPTTSGLTTATPAGTAGGQG